MKAVITLTLSEEMTEEFAKELGEREPEKLACLIKGWWSGYISQSKFAKEVSLDAKVVESEGKPTRFKVGDKVKLSDKAKEEIFPCNLPPVKELTLSFDISKGFWPERQSVADLPILISCPAYEKVIGWTTGGEVKQDGDNVTVALSAMLYEKNELVLSMLLSGIELGETKVSPQFEVFDCHKDETTGLTIVGQAELTAIVLYPKAYGRDEEADRLFKVHNDFDSSRSRQQ